MKSFGHRVVATTLAVILLEVSAVSIAASEDAQRELRVTLAKQQLYGANVKPNSGYKWGITSQRAQNKRSVSYANKANHANQYDWQQKELFIDSLQDKDLESSKLSGYEWAVRSNSDQAGYKWGIRSGADQAGYKWGIRSNTDQAGYKWGIR